MGRNGTLEYARLIAAFGIVFFHAKAPGGAIGYAALPFFIIILIVMAIPTAEKQAFIPYVKGRAKRLLHPWLIWSMIYAALKLVEVLITDRPLSEEFNMAMVLTGPALHLWFLPFAFAACLAVYPVIPLIQNSHGFALPLVLGAAALGIILLQQHLDMPAPLSQWSYSLPAVFMGLILALRHIDFGLRVLFLAAFIATALLMGATFGLLQLGLAVGVFLLCTEFPTPNTALSQQAGAAAMGVYLAHPLVLSVLTRTTTLPDHSTALAVVACAGALGVTLCLSTAQKIHRADLYKRAKSHV